MHELDFEQLTQLKKQLEEHIGSEEYSNASNALGQLWNKIEYWYYNEQNPTEIYTTDIYSPAVHQALETRQGAQAENHRALFTRDWRCPYCGSPLKVEYIQQERYLVKCDCHPLRIQYVRANSPDRAAARVGTLNTWHQYGTNSHQIGHVTNLTIN